MGLKIFDAHCDTINAVFAAKSTLKNNRCMVNADMLKMHDAYVQVFALWINEAESDNPLLQAIKRADKFYEEMNKNSFTVIKNAKTLNETMKNGKVGAILAIENGLALCGSLEVLNMLYKLGVRLITLTHNGKNELGVGAMTENVGLTPFGRDVVEKMNLCGMAVDASHISENGFWDILGISKKPIIVSHSNARAVCAHKRNLTDEQIRAVIKNGGVIGINLFPKFLNGKEKASVKDVLLHIEHMLSLGAENNIGIGTDFDGIESTPKGLENAEKLKTLFYEMKKIGYSDELTEKISHKNFLRAFGDILEP